MKARSRAVERERGMDQIMRAGIII
jgi:hypothetical protein